MLMVSSVTPRQEAVSSTSAMSSAASSAPPFVLVGARCFVVISAGGIVSVIGAFVGRIVVRAFVLRRFGGAVVTAGVGSVRHRRRRKPAATRAATRRAANRR